MNLTEQITQLKTELREFIALSETITQGRWIEEIQLGTGGNHCGIDLIQDNLDEPYRGPIARVGECSHIQGITAAERDANAAFIARSRNISPAMAKMLLVAIDSLESADVYLPKSDDTARDALQQLLKLWEETK